MLLLLFFFFIFFFFGNRFLVAPHGLCVRVWLQCVRENTSARRAMMIYHLLCYYIRVSEITHATFTPPAITAQRNNKYIKSPQPKKYKTIKIIQQNSYRKMLLLIFFVHLVVLNINLIYRLFFIPIWKILCIICLIFFFCFRSVVPVDWQYDHLKNLYFEVSNYLALSKNWLENVDWIKGRKMPWINNFLIKKTWLTFMQKIKSKQIINLFLSG